MHNKYKSQTFLFYLESFGSSLFLVKPRLLSNWEKKVCFNVLRWKPCIFEIDMNAQDNVQELDILWNASINGH